MSDESHPSDIRARSFADFSTALRNEVTDVSAETGSSHAIANEHDPIRDEEIVCKSTGNSGETLIHTQSEQARVIVNLSDVIKALGAQMTSSGQSSRKLEFESKDINKFVRSLTRALSFVATSRTDDDPAYKTIVPPEICENSVIGSAAATLDMHKVKLLMATSKIDLRDLNAYASLIMRDLMSRPNSRQRRVLRDENALRIYVPTVDEVNQFLDDNPVIVKIIANHMPKMHHYHILKAFTHESATDGVTSSKLLANIGRYAIRTYSYRIAYDNGESFIIAKENSREGINEDKFYDQAIKLKFDQAIVVGSQHYKADRQIVLQTVYAIFGLFFNTLGIEGLIYFNTYINWTKTIDYYSW